MSLTSQTMRKIDGGLEAYQVVPVLTSDLASSSQGHLHHWKQLAWCCHSGTTDHKQESDQVMR